MFENEKMKIYKSTIKTYVINEIHEIIEDFNRQQLKMREVLKQMKTRYFELQNLTAEFEKNQKQRLLILWVSHLKQLIGPIRKQKAKKALKKLQKKGLILDETIHLNENDDDYQSKNKNWIESMTVCL